MKNSFQKAQKAEKLLDNLAVYESNRLRPLVEDIQKIQREMDAALIQMETAERCRDCIDCCCAPGIEDTLSGYYYFFLFFDLPYETKFRVWEVLQGDPPGEFCRFLKKTGCIFPSDKRPFICKNFYCKKFGPVQKVMQAYSQRFDDAFYRLYVKLNRLKGETFHESELGY